MQSHVNDKDKAVGVHDQYIAYLAEIEKKGDKSPLHEAIIKGNDELFQKLSKELSAGAEYNLCQEKGPYKVPVKHAVIWYGQPAMLTSILHEIYPDNCTLSSKLSGLIKFAIKIIKEKDGLHEGHFKAAFVLLNHEIQLIDKNDASKLAQRLAVLETLYIDWIAFQCKTQSENLMDTIGDFLREKNGKVIPVPSFLNFQRISRLVSTYRDKPTELKTVLREAVSQQIAENKLNDELFHAIDVCYSLSVDDKKDAKPSIPGNYDFWTFFEKYEKIIIEVNDPLYRNLAFALQIFKVYLPAKVTMKVAVPKQHSPLSESKLGTLDGILQQHTEEAIPSSEPFLRFFLYKIYFDLFDMMTKDKLEGRLNEENYGEFLALTKLLVECYRKELSLNSPYQTVLLNFMFVQLNNNAYLKNNLDLWKELINALVEKFEFGSFKVRKHIVSSLKELNEIRHFDGTYKSLVKSAFVLCLDRRDRFIRSQCERFSEGIQKQLLEGLSEINIALPHPEQYKAEFRYRLGDSCLSLLQAALIAEDHFRLHERILSDDEILTLDRQARVHMLHIYSVTNSFLLRNAIKKFLNIGNDKNNDIPDISHNYVREMIVQAGYDPEVVKNNLRSAVSAVTKTTRELGERFREVCERPLEQSENKSIESVSKKMGDDFSRFLNAEGDDIGVKASALCFELQNDYFTINAPRPSAFTGWNNLSSELRRVTNNELREDNIQKILATLGGKNTLPSDSVITSYYLFYGTLFHLLHLANSKNYNEKTKASIVATILRCLNCLPVSADKSAQRLFDCVFKNLTYIVIKNRHIIDIAVLMDVLKRRFESGSDDVKSDVVAKMKTFMRFIENPGYKGQLNSAWRLFEQYYKAKLTNSGGVLNQKLAENYYTVRMQCALSEYLTDVSEIVQSTFKELANFDNVFVRMCAIEGLIKDKKDKNNDVPFAEKEVPIYEVGLLDMANDCLNKCNLPLALKYYQLVEKHGEKKKTIAGDWIKKINSDRMTVESIVHPLLDENASRNHDGADQKRTVSESKKMPLAGKSKALELVDLSGLSLFGTSVTPSVPSKLEHKTADDQDIADWNKKLDGLAAQYEKAKTLDEKSKTLSDIIQLKNTVSSLDIFYKLALRKCLLMCYAVNLKLVKNNWLSESTDTLDAYSRQIMDISNELYDPGYLITNNMKSFMMDELVSLANNSKISVREKAFKAILVQEPDFLNDDANIKRIEQFLFDTAELYLKNNNKEKAVVYLGRVCQSGKEYQEKARQLLMSMLGELEGDSLKTIVEGYVARHSLLSGMRR